MEDIFEKVLKDQLGKVLLKMILLKPYFKTLKGICTQDGLLNHTSRPSLAKAMHQGSPLFAQTWIHEIFCEADCYLLEFLNIISHNGHLYDT